MVFVVSRCLLEHRVLLECCCVCVALLQVIAAVVVVVINTTSERDPIKFLFSDRETRPWSHETLKIAL